jgi:hypothetical protein
MRYDEAEVEMPRLEIGTEVLVRSTIFSRYVGHYGLISGVIPHKTRKHTLDKYEVTFENGEISTFWDIQLQACGSCNSSSGDDTLHGDFSRPQP